MISVFLQGGLGNQLFQIFTTIAHSIKMNSTFVFTYDEVLNYGTIRYTYWNTFLNLLERFTTKDKTLTNHDVQQFIRYNERNFHYDELPNFGKVNVTLFGYYQSYKYFDFYKEHLFSLIDLETQQNNMEKYLNCKNINVDTDKLISMHFRIGDYVDKPDYHPIMTYNYYSSAMRTLRDKKITSGIVLYFCENKDNDRVNIMIDQLKNENKDFSFVKIDDYIPDWEQMLIMSCCHCNIIANSSFSWWGAYFNKHRDTSSHIAIYPSTWFGPSLRTHNLKDLHPPTWICVTV